jgi:hypothetical protein
MTESPDRKNDLHQHPDLQLAPQLQNLSCHFSGTLPAKYFPKKKEFLFLIQKNTKKKRTISGQTRILRYKTINGHKRQERTDQGRTKINQCTGEENGASGR